MSSHSSIKDPMAKVYLLIISLFILATVFFLISSLVNTISSNSLKGEIDTEALIANNTAMTVAMIKPIGEVTSSDGSGAAVSASGSARPAEEVYNAVCMACHATGAAGAPKLDDKAAWEPRVATGIDALMKSAINGKGAMPPRGGQDVSDEELKATIGYMAMKAGFNLDLGASPAAATEAKEEAPAKAAPEAKEEAPNAPATPKTPAKPNTPKAPAAPAEETASEATVTEEAAPQKKQAPEEVAAAPAADSNISGEKVYKATCFACHDMGVAGSPKIGDKAIWASRITAGKEVMYNSAINGKTTPAGMMPAKGGNTNLSDDEVKAAVDYMISQSQ